MVMQVHWQLTMQWGSRQRSCNCTGTWPCSEAADDCRVGRRCTRVCSGRGSAGLQWTRLFGLIECSHSLPALHRGLQIIIIINNGHGYALSTALQWARIEVGTGCSGHGLKFAQIAVDTGCSRHGSAMDTGLQHTCLQWVRVCSGHGSPVGTDCSGHGSAIGTGYSGHGSAVGTGCSGKR